MPEIRQFSSDTHAMVTGIVLGALVKAKDGALPFTVESAVDEYNNYLPWLILKHDGQEYRIYVVETQGATP